MKKALIALTLLLAACHSGGDTISPEELPGLVAIKRAPVEGPGRCGFADAVVVTEAAGVKLSNPALMNMRTARTLDRWLRTAAVPAFGERGGGLTEISVIAHYACRNRNGTSVRKLSEHALGNAIDISGFVMADGSRITVLRGWNSERDGPLLKTLHRSACGPFGTVLGPRANAAHRDHFHFDTAAYRSGAYCR